MVMGASSPRAIDDAFRAWLLVQRPDANNRSSATQALKARAIHKAQQIGCRTHSLLE
jgi:hypothetical protein